MRIAILITVALMLVATAAVADSKWPSDYVPGTPTQGDRVGGDTMADATVIPNPLPFSDSGDTSTFTNDYDAVCPYTGSTSPDVVYSYTACDDGALDITLCANSAYDTKLYVFDAGGNEIACNDDTCPGYVSELTAANGEAVPIAAGASYFIVVDGYGGDMGYYTIDITGPVCTTATEDASWSKVKAQY